MKNRYNTPPLQVRFHTGREPFQSLALAFHVLFVRVRRIDVQINQRTGQQAVTKANPAHVLVRLLQTRIVDRVAVLVRAAHVAVEGADAREFKVALGAVFEQFGAGAHQGFVIGIADALEGLSETLT